ncbi:MAG TPA: hypothetical protein VNV66_09015 [Pilimelia sp.]|nr:hypothetical protein [Pilimelia sp.]
MRRGRWRPGSPSRSWSRAAGEVGQLAIEINLPRPDQEDPELVRRPYLFTDAHELLRR